VHIKRKAMMILSVMSSVTLLASCASKPAEPPAYDASKKLHIAAWVAPPPEYISSESYRVMSESGIRVAYGLYEDVDVNALKALDYAHEHGMQYMVRSRGIGSLPEDELELMEGMFDQVVDHPAFAGVLVRDEPGAGEFDRLGALYRKFKELYPDKLFYVNLFPTYSSLDQRHGRTYKEYIDEYIEKVATPYISYDHYPLVKNVSGTDIREDYLLNLEIVSQAAKKAGIPFWVFIQSIGYWTAGTENRIPEEADIRWQVYNSLVFGAQGIQYFTYWTPENDNLTQFSDAMIDRAGNKTPLYDAVRNVNEEIARFESLYLHYNHVGVQTYPTEGAPGHLYIEHRLESFAPIAGVKSEHPVVIGAFEDDDGHAAFILVNYTDPAKKLTNKVSVSLSQKYELLQYDRHGETRLPKTKTYEVELAPGEGKFVSLLK